MFATVSVHGTMGKEAAGRWRALWLVWVVVAWVAQPSLAQRLIWLGTLPGGFWSEAYGVSADGSVVVGYAYNAVVQRTCLSLDGGAWDAGPRHATGRLLERGLWCFRRWLRGGRLG
jgi:uncharacterized membrane protein